MSTFEERERGFEALFAHDESLRFRALSRRNKALAEWAAARMGQTGEAVATYQHEILGLALDGRGDDALAKRVAGDLAAAGTPVSPDEVRTEMARLLAAAIADGTAD